MIDISRTYALERDGTELPVVLRIFGSEELDSSTWAVRFTISGLDERSAQPRVIYGADAIQAVLCALKVARAVLQSDPHYRGGNLTLQGAAPEDPLGLSL